MKNEKVIALWNKLNLDEEGKNRIINKIKEKQKKRRPIFRTKMVAAIAVLICLAALGRLFATPSETNIFSVKAYALEQQKEGGVGLREVDLLNQPDVWGGHFDGDNFYVGVGLRYEGENIKSVDFITTKGFFAKQYINKLSDGEAISKMYVGPDSRLVMYGEDFEIAGDKITLDDETMTDDLLLFWGIEATNMSEVPKKIEITAKATFNDGKTQELPVTIDLSGEGVFGGVVLSEEESQEIDRQCEYYDNLSLEQCELVEESVKTVTDVYEYSTEDSTTWFPIDDQLEFDEDGFIRCELWTDSDGKVIISVIKRDSNGALTGMFYRVPENLIYKE